MTSKALPRTPVRPPTLSPGGDIESSALVSRKLFINVNPVNIDLKSRQTTTLVSKLSETSSSNASDVRSEGSGVEIQVKLSKVFNQSEATLSGCQPLSLAPGEQERKLQQLSKQRQMVTEQMEALKKY